VKSNANLNTNIHHPYLLNKVLLHMYHWLFTRSLPIQDTGVGGGSFTSLVDWRGLLSQTHQAILIMITSTPISFNYPRYPLLQTSPVRLRHAHSHYI